MIPGPEAEITKCLSRRGRFPGSPGKLISGGSDFDVFGGPPDFGGSGWRGDFVPISYIYREGCLGGPAVTTRRGGGYRTLSPVPEAGAQHYRAGGER